MKQTLSENIQKFRLAMGISQVTLAKALNVSKQCVSNWENDNVQPSIEMLVRLSDHFGVSTDALLGRAGSEMADLSGLTDEQAAHIRQLILDLAAANRGTP